MDNSYFFLDIEISKKGLFLDEGQVEPEEILEVHNKGISLSKQNINITLFVRRDKKLLSISPNLFSLLIVSCKMRKVFEKFEPNNIEFYDVELIDTVSDNPARNFFFANILQNVNAINYEDSNIEYYADSKVIKRVQKLRLNHEEIGSRNIFRIVGLRSKLLVSKKVKEQIITDFGQDNFQFTPINQFKKGGWFDKINKKMKN